MSTNAQNNDSQNKADQKKLDASLAQSTDKSKHEQDNTHNTNKDADELYEKKYKRLRKLVYRRIFCKWNVEKKINILEVIGAAVAIYALYILIGQSAELKKTTEIADKTLKLTEKSNIISNRAYIVVPEMTANLLAYNSVNVYFVIKNCGQTPAYDVRDSVCVKIIQSGTEPDTTKFTHSIGKTTYGSQDEQSDNIQSVEIIGESDLKQIESGSLKIYFWGRITYKDIFGNRHITRFCSEYVADAGKFRTYKNYDEAN